MIRYHNPAWRSIVRARRWIGQFPALYFPIARLVKPRTFSWSATTRDSALVLEGYPGSANTFAFVAFELAQQRPTVVAHHCHVPAQILRGLKLSIPCVVLLRHPDDAIVSNLTRWDHLTTREALLDYLAFYQPLWSARDQFLTVRFEDAVTDFGAVIDRINDRFGTSFTRFEHTAENVARVAAIMKQNTSNKWHRSLPDGSRDVARQSVLAQLNQPAFDVLRGQCLQCFEQFSNLT